MSKSAHAEAKRGRKPALGLDHVDALRGIVHEHPHSTLEEVTRELGRRTGTRVCSVTVRKALRQAGIGKTKPPRKREAPQVAHDERPTRYGYTDRHRRQDGQSGMNTDLTDAEWALVSDLFAHEGGRGRPAKHPRRYMVDACCYAVRTGCAWRLLPKSFPPWAAVHKAFSRWAAAGVIDAQSNHSSAQGGMTGFDAGKKVKGRKRHL